MFNRLKRFLNMSKLCCQWDFVMIFRLKWHYSFPPTHPFFFLLKYCCDIRDIRIVVGEEGLVKPLIRLRWEAFL